VESDEPKYFNENSDGILSCGFWHRPYVTRARYYAGDNWNCGGDVTYYATMGCNSNLGVIGDSYNFLTIPVYNVYLGDQCPGHWKQLKVDYY